MGMQEQLLAVSPLDGRYADKVAELQPIVSEYGLFKRRVDVALGWVGMLASGILPDVERMPDSARNALDDIGAGFGLQQAEEVKALEAMTNHDVNAAIRWIKERMRNVPELQPYSELTHYGCTSEDLNNMSYALMLRDLREDVLKPQLVSVDEDLDGKASAYAEIPLLARTHGQPASPTTLGKELRVFQSRLSQHIRAIGDISILGKYGGASGNHNALTFAYPEVDWIRVCSDFVVGNYGLVYNVATTQVEPHDWMAAFFREMATGNTILRDLGQDIWLYIMNGEFKQHVIATEDGSSAMPHKVNPIDFENARGNLVVANALWNCLADNLPISRLQRDLEDSTTQRAIGEAAGHNLVAYKSLKKGLGKIYPDENRMVDNLNAEWGVLMEPLQTIMRRYGMEGAYDTVKAASRDKHLGREEYVALIDSIDGLPEEAKQRLRALTPTTYTGRAAEIAR